MVCGPRLLLGVGLVPQLTAQDLAYVALWQFITELKVLGYLVGGQTLPTELLEFVGELGGLLFF